MSITINNLKNENRISISEKGPFSVLEYIKDINPLSNAQKAYFMSKMEVRQRQLLIKFDGSNSKLNTAVVQAGAMQWIAGDVSCKTGIKGAGDFIGKMFKGAVTNESSVKPEYTGDGCMMLEPTYKHIILIDVAEWGTQGIKIEDGMFLACQGTINQGIESRKSLSSAVAGNEGMFNLNLRGHGIAALESIYPEKDLIEIILDNDEIKIDGNIAVCWSGSLTFTVERSSKSLMGSAVNGEGLVNVYRGTGKVLMQPIKDILI